ncbi:uncharacterized protein TNCV_777931 [Trichonephila clavipes]|nr:uncharacterized protein TNCV_777931 [Trichonephila clavipes]
MITIHLLAPLYPGQQAAEGRLKLDYKNRSRNVLLQFLKTMGVVAIHFRLEGSPQKRRHKEQDNKYKNPILFSLLSKARQYFSPPENKAKTDAKANSLPSRKDLWVNKPISWWSERCKVKNFSKFTIQTKHRSHASRIPSTIQSPSCHLAKCKTPLSPCPSSKTCPDMGLRTVLTVQKPKKATPIQRLMKENAYSKRLSW